MSKKPLHARILYFFSRIYKSLRFFYHYSQERRKYGNYYFPYMPLHKGEFANILANGPSLNMELEDLLKDNISLQNSLVANYFVFNEFFQQIKPKYYCLADPLFFNEDRYNDNVVRLFVELNKVSWEMDLFVCIQGVDTIKKYIKNSNITVKGISTLRFEGFESERNRCYMTGKAVPSFINVTIMGLYILINLGYDSVKLFGVDHTFLTNLIVGDDNILYIEDCHFYGTEKVIAEYHSDGTPWKVAEFIYDKYLTFVEHEIMRGYADYLGAQIINCTKDSWIDAYVRKAQLDKQSE